MFPEKIFYTKDDKKVTTFYVTLKASFNKFDISNNLNKIPLVN